MSHRDTSASAASQLANIASFLLRSSLQPSSIPTYKRAWKRLHQFFANIFQLPFPGLPISPSVLALYVAYLFDKHYAPSTVNTYFSTLRFSHKLMSLSDSTKIFYVCQMLKGYHKKGFRLDSRLPTFLPILHRLILVAPQLQGSPYQICQFQAMYSLTFHAFLRLGEITSIPSQASSPPQLYQITKLLSATGDLVSYKVTFGNYQHQYNERLFFLIIVSRQSVSCPIALLTKYLVFRGFHPGPLFMTVDRLPVTRSWFSTQLSLAIQLCGLYPSRYKDYSFRISAASHAVEQGLSDAPIRLLGRWKSNSFQKYLWVPCLSSQPLRNILMLFLLFEWAVSKSGCLPRGQGLSIFPLS